MVDPDEHALVVLALTSGLSNCVRWSSEAMSRITGDPDLRGLTPRAIKDELIAFVEGGGEVRQVVETRREYVGHYRFYYKAIVPFDGFVRGVFVEITLTDDDPDCPMVRLVNAHPQLG